MHHPKKTGLSIVTRVMEASSAIRTTDQLGGQGDVYNRALAIPGHSQTYGSPLASLEYVILAPTRNAACPTTIGAHTQETDEIYFLVSGEEGILTTNGHEALVHPGDLVLAPKGTCHSLRNTTDSPLALLVVEVHAPDTQREPAILSALPKKLHPDFSWYAASVPLRGIRIPLQDYFSGFWGALSLIEIPPGGRIHPHTSEEEDQILLIVGVNATLLIEHERENMEGFGLSAFIPCGVEQGLVNQSSRDPLLVVVINLPHCVQERHHA